MGKFIYATTAELKAADTGISSGDMFLVKGEPDLLEYDSTVSSFDEVTTYQATGLGVGAFVRRARQSLSLAALSAVDNASDGLVVHVTEHTSGTTLGGGLWEYRSLSSDTVDNGLVAAATGMGAGRWHRIIPDNTITPEMFGAVPGQITDYSTELQAALDAWVSGDYNLRGAGEYRTDSQLVVSSSCEGDLSLRLWMPFAGRLGAIKFANSSAPLRYKGKIQLWVTKGRSSNQVAWSSLQGNYTYAARYDSEDTLGGGENTDTDTDTIREKLRAEAEIGVWFQDVIYSNDIHVRLTNGFCIGVLVSSGGTSVNQNALWSTYHVDEIKSSKFGLVIATDRRTNSNAACNSNTFYIDKMRQDGIDLAADSSYVIVMESFGDIGSAAQDYAGSHNKVYCCDVEMFDTATDTTLFIGSKATACEVHLGRYESITYSRLYRFLRYTDGTEVASIKNLVTVEPVPSPALTPWDFPNEGNDWPNVFEVRGGGGRSNVVHRSWRIRDEWQPSASNWCYSTGLWAFSYYSNLTSQRTDQAYGTYMRYDYITGEVNAPSAIFMMTIGIEFLDADRAPLANRIIETVRHCKSNNRGWHYFTLFDSSDALLDSTNDAPPVYWMQFDDLSNKIALSNNGTHNRWKDGGVGDNDRVHSRYSFHPDVRKVWLSFAGTLQEIEVIVRAPGVRFFNIAEEHRQQLSMPAIADVPQRGYYTQGWSMYDLGVGPKYCTTAGWAVKGDWTTATAYSIYDHVQSNSNLYEATNAATSGVTAPSGTTIGGTESDGAVTWKCIAVGITKAVIA